MALDCPYVADCQPTAQQSTESTHEMFSSRFSAVPGFGVVTTDQLFPFHHSASDVVPPPLAVE